VHLPAPDAGHDLEEGALAALGKPQDTDFHGDVLFYRLFKNVWCKAPEILSREAYFLVR
jgi:hypothetical protein